MRIAIVGPTHPYKGGIAKHTTELAHHLSAAGHDVEILSWRAQYPFFYPGEQFVPDAVPELPPHAHTRRVLSWKNPASWLRTARHLRQFDRIIFIWWVPTIQGPIYWSILKALGRTRPHITVVCHNVLPHEAKPGDAKLAHTVLAHSDLVVVHSESQAKLARSLAKAPVAITQLPLILPVKPGSLKKGKRSGLLFVGFVRPYKGLDVLLRAIALVPEASLTVAGEFWGGPAAHMELVHELGLEQRVTLRPGYLPEEEMATMISRAEAMVLPYISGTATWNATLAHAYGTPVIATTASSLGEQVQSGVDGLLCEPNNVKALASAIEQFYKPGVAEKLRKGIQPLATESQWEQYTKTVLQG